MLASLTWISILFHLPAVPLTFAPILRHGLQRRKTRIPLARSSSLDEVSTVALMRLVFQTQLSPAFISHMLCRDCGTLSFPSWIIQQVERQPVKLPAFPINNFVLVYAYFYKAHLESHLTRATCQCAYSAKASSSWAFVLRPLSAVSPVW